MDNQLDIELDVQARFRLLAQAPDQEQRFPVGPASAKQLGYPAKVIDSFPASVTESFAGVGYPFALGDLQTGRTVLDVGCGAGLDSLLAAEQVGETGHVIGVDFVESMIAKARHNAALLRCPQVEFRHASATQLPVSSESVHVLLSNGVFNLCADKSAVVAEWFRVLRPGGRLQMADILLEAHATPEQVDQLGLWSD